MENTVLDTNLGSAIPDISNPGFTAPVGQELWQLIQLWQNERFAPDVLTSEETLLGSILDKIKQQVRRILCSYSIDLFNCEFPPRPTI